MTVLVGMKAVSVLVNTTDVVLVRSVLGNVVTTVEWGTVRSAPSVFVMIDSVQVTGAEVAEYSCDSMVVTNVDVVVEPCA